MNILIIDGNKKEASEKYTQMGMPTQYEVYENILRKLLKKKNCNIATIHPATFENYIPQGLSLDDFQGVVWTGSVLNIYNSGKSIERQIILAKELFNKKNKIFGSCWGLQVLVTAAGGKIRKNPRGLEAVIAKKIIQNKNGINHPIYINKPRIFDSFCWHYDEVEELPINTSILSSNYMSDVQAVAFTKGKSDIWAVQYHPEFDSKWIAGLMKQRKSLLLEEGIYESSDKFDTLYSYLSDIKKFKDLKTKLSISKSLIDEGVHSKEISNWLNTLSI